MLTYTTCPGCEKSHVVTRTGDEAHEGCPIPWPRNLRYLLNDALVAGNLDAAAQYERELDALDEAPPRFLDAALTYASWGWPVFPCVPGQKRPIVKHGLREATVDREMIRLWWEAWPKANVAVATGHLFDVVDVDPAGIHWWANVRERYGNQPGGPLPDVHGEVATPRPGGTHVYVQPTGRGNLADLKPGVDYRGRGGYVLVPPSVLSPSAYTDHGKPAPNVAHLTYTWAVYPSPMIKLVDPHNCRDNDCGGWRDDPPCGGCCGCRGYCVQVGPSETSDEFEPEEA